MNKIPLTLLTLFTFALAAADAMACSCMASGYEDGLKSTAKNAMLSAAKTDVVAVANAATVKETSPRKGMFIQQVTFSLVSSIKGELGHAFTLSDNDVSGGSCGYSFEQGETYLLYMSKSEAGQLYTNSCTRTKRKPSDGDDEHSKARWAVEIKSLASAK